MTRFRLRRKAGLLLGLVVLTVLLLGAGLLGTRYGRRYLEQQLREQLAASSDLRVSPFQVGLNWRDFPHLTASVRQLVLTDTSHHGAVPVLTIPRADLRLNLLSLLRGRLRVDAATLYDAELRAYVDRQGRRWTLHGRRRPGPGRAPVTFDLPTVRLLRTRLHFRNDYKLTRFVARVAEARLAARQRGGQLLVSGQLHGTLDTLRRRTGDLLTQEPVRARVRYRYSFARRQGAFDGSRAILRGDTMHISGTHTTASRRPTGSWLNLRFEGHQALMQVLPRLLPPTMLPYIAGARSPSRAHIRYAISGLSSPTAQPRTRLHLELRRARLVWPDSTRRISRWDLRALYDTGPARQPATTSLTLEQCRIYSPIGQLDMALRVTDFTRPVVQGRLRGRTDLPALAALVAPGTWRARAGAAELDVRLRGPLPALNGQPRSAAGGRPLSMRGWVALHDAAFDVPSRRARVTGLNGRLGLQDSLWRLEALRGQVDGMHFRATANTLYLFSYLTGQRPTTRISGTFAVDELRVARLGELLRPASRAVPIRRRPSPAPDSPATLLPPGLQLRVGLRCARLVLPTDTLRDVTVQVRRDARRTTLSGLSARVWGGEVRGLATWPAPQVRTPGEFRLGLRFGSMDYARVARLIRRSLLAGGARPGSQGAPPAPRPQRPASPLRRLLLTANGQISCEVTTLRMPVGENLRHVRLRVHKTGSDFRLPGLYFATSSGGVGYGEASAHVANGRLQSATASLDLRYATLDVQRLLLLLASLKPDDQDEYIYGADEPRTRTARADSAAEARSERAEALLSGRLLTARLHVRAERVRYGALSGTDFRLNSRLRPGEARLEECSLQAFGGQVRLRGRLQTHPAADGSHPLHVQALLERIELPQLFGLADALRFDVLGSENVRGTMHCEADVYTALDSTFLPAVAQTRGYARADLQNLELLRVAALQQALRFIGQKKAEHLFFRPVSTQVFLEQGRLLIPRLRLNSNLTDMEISGEYGLNGRTNLYVGLNPVQALVGNNRRRIARIRSGSFARHPDRHLLYLNLRRPQGGVRYAVRPFQRRQQKQQQTALQQEFRRLMLRQPIDTTLRLLRPPQVR